MVRQRRPSGVYWEFPGGYCEPGESLEQTAGREVLEETAVVVEVGELICTVVWEREHDQRRNVLAYFGATPVDPAAKPRPQSEEDIEDAAFLDPSEVSSAGIHPLEAPIIERWWRQGATGFHLRADVVVYADDRQSYEFR